RSPSCFCKSAGKTGATARWRDGMAIMLKGVSVVCGAATCGFWLLALGFLSSARPKALCIVFPDRFQFIGPGLGRRLNMAVNPQFPACIGHDVIHRYAGMDGGKIGSAVAAKTQYALGGNHRRGTAAG